MQALGETPLSIDRDGLAATERLIRRYIRHTPAIAVDAADFGLAAAPLVFKLEFVQHAGSFKPRGAFADLLTRTAPAAGVVAASGGNHGAAVAYAALRLGVRTAIFVPRVTSAAKCDRIRSYGAELVVIGESYAEALAASEERAARWRFTPTTRPRRGWARAASGSSWRPTGRSSTRCWLRSAAAA
jgi:threonine dehydratase